MKLKFCRTVTIKQRVKSGNGELSKRLRFPVVYKIRDKSNQESISDSKASMLYEYYRVYGYDDYMT